MTQYLSIFPINMQIWRHWSIRVLYYNLPNALRGFIKTCRMNHSVSCVMNIINTPNGIPFIWANSVAKVSINSKRTSMFKWISFYRISQHDIHSHNSCMNPHIYEFCKIHHFNFIFFILCIMIFWTKQDQLARPSKVFT